MSRTKRFIGGLAVGYANQALITLVGLWLVVFLLDRLGQSDYGLWLITGQILGYLGLLDLGVVALLPRETAYATGQAQTDGSTPDIGKLVSRAVSLALIQTPLVGLGAGILWYTLPDQWEPIRIPLAFVLSGFVVLFPFRVLEATLRGLQDLAFLGRARLVSWFVGTATLVLLVFNGFGLYGLAVGWIVQHSSLVGLSWLRLRRQYADALPRSLASIRNSDTVEKLTRGLWVSVSQVAHVLLSGTDVLLIGLLMSPALTVPYAITGKLITVLAHLPQMLTDTAEPGLSELKTAESKERVSVAASALTQATLIFSGGLVVVILAVNEAFISWWVGTEQWGGMLLSVLILLRVLLSHWNLTLGTALFCFGYERRLAITGLGTGIVTVGLSAVLIKQYGIIGAPLGAICGTCLASIPPNLSALAREISVQRIQLLGTQWPWLWRFTLVAGPASLLAIRGLPATVPVLVSVTIGVAVFYGLMMIPRFVSPPLATYLHPRVLEVLQKLPAPLR